VDDRVVLDLRDLPEVEAVGLQGASDLSHGRVSPIESDETAGSGGRYRDVPTSNTGGVVFEAETVEPDSDAGLGEVFGAGREGPTGLERDDEMLLRLALVDDPVSVLVERRNLGDLVLVGQEVLVAVRLALIEHAVLVEIIRIDSNGRKLDELGVGTKRNHEFRAEAEITLPEPHVQRARRGRERDDVRQTVAVDVEREKIARRVSALETNGPAVESFESRLENLDEGFCRARDRELESRLEAEVGEGDRSASIGSVEGPERVEVEDVLAPHILRVGTTVVVAVFGVREGKGREAVEEEPAAARD